MDGKRPILRGASLVPFAVLSLVSMIVAAQAPTAPKLLGTTSQEDYRAPRTPDGQPDLQGYWTNATFTPLQRPENVDKEFYTAEEAVALATGRAGEESELPEADHPGGRVHYDFTQFGLDKSQSGVVVGRRTSLIFDPPDGRIPPLTPAGRQRMQARETPSVMAPARGSLGEYTDRVQNASLYVRCILSTRSGPPMYPLQYNNTYHIVQTPGYVLILVEMIHDARIIPLDGRPHVPESVRHLMGSSRGRWEGETLVVETTNFTDRTAFPYPFAGDHGASENLGVIERFTRAAEDEIRYEFTIDDPATWTRPWSAALPMKRTIGPVWEHACHEGNYGLYNTLAGARAEEKRAVGEGK